MRPTLLCSAGMFEIKQKAKMTERALLIAAFTESANEANAQSLLE